MRAAAIAQWFRLRPPSCGCGFESQAHHLCFLYLYYKYWNEKRTKINKKEAGIRPIFEKMTTSEEEERHNLTFYLKKRAISRPLFGLFFVFSNKHYNCYNK